MNRAYSLLLVLSLCTFVSNAQTSQDTIISFTKIVTVDSVAKEQLYLNARQWFNDIFKNLNSVLKIDDKESGQLSGSFRITSSYSLKGVVAAKQSQLFPVTLFMDFNVFLKDGRYKYEFTNIFEETETNSGRPNIMGVLRNTTKAPGKFTLMSQKRSDEIYQSTIYYLNKYMEKLTESFEKQVATNHLRNNF